MNINNNSPDNWQIFYEKIQQMRNHNNAPVDNMGCHKCYDINADINVQRFQILVSLILSSQTKDQITFSVMNKLINHGLTIDSILNISEENLQQLLIPVGFYKKKAIYLKKIAHILQNNYNSILPNDIKQIIKLPGVGPKIAYLFMNVAFHQILGIAVDTHVNRITKRIGWIHNLSSTPEQTRLSLQSWLPISYWNHINSLFVGFGQQICLPIKPKCQQCLLYTHCPSSTYFKH